MKQKVKITTALCSLGLALVVGLPFVFNIVQNIFVVKAEEAYASTGSAVNYDADFFSNANTYNATLEETDVRGSTTGATYNSVSYNMDEKRTDVVVSDDAPQVTFITHGLSGSAAHWSNGSGDPDWGFAYSPGSIIDLLQQKASCNIYLAKINSIDDTTDEIDLEKIELKLYQLEHNNYFSTTDNEIENITDNTKHSIVIFEGDNTGQSNDYIYTQFNIMASKVVLDLQALDANNELPRVNLIGHSRGGLTNLQYALDHPDLVDSIFSLGTPYLGSTSASIDNHILGGAFTNNSVGEDDITDSEIYLDYLEEWNSNYESLYSDINVHALGGYQSLDMLVYQMVYPFISQYLEEDIIDITAKSLLKALNIYLSVELGVLNNGEIPNVVKQELLSGVLNIVYRFIPDLKNCDPLINGITAIFDLLLDEIEFNNLTLSYDLLNDGLVDLPSQLGLDHQSNNAYKGFIRETKRFGIFDDYNLDKAATSTFRVTHNLEPLDETLLRYIVTEISMSHNTNGSPYLLVDVSTENCPDAVSIIGYIGQNVNGTLTIPENIYFNDGDLNESNNYKTVVAIGPEAFANNMNGEIDITEVVIPKTVKTIGTGAFYNNEYLEKITINGVSDKTSALTTISAGAFSHIPKLNEFTIPSNVTSIEERVFENSGITTIESYSSYFVWQNHLLINCNVSDPSNKIAIYVNPTATSISIPDGVGTLSAYLFCGNKNIAQLNLNQVKYIGSNAFLHSNLTTLNGVENIIEADMSSFIGTPWLENQTSEFLAVGGVLIAYNGTESNVEIPEGIIRVGENAFLQDNIQSIILPSTIESIGQGAFRNCANLNWVLINAANPPILDGDCFSETVTIYVRYISLDEYLDNIFFQNIDNAITAKTVNVVFYEKDGTYIDEREEFYYSTFDEYPEAKKITGETFISWKDINGVQVKQNDIFKFVDDVVLTAYYEPSKYTIFISDEEYTVIYGEEVDFGCPSEDGREFIGCFDC